MSAPTFKDGDRVRVVKVPDESPDYHSTLGKTGTIEGNPFKEDTEQGVIWWAFVTLDGENIATEFRCDELEPLQPEPPTFTLEQVEEAQSSVLDEMIPTDANGERSSLHITMQNVLREYGERVRQRLTSQQGGGKG